MEGGRVIARHDLERLIEAVVDDVFDEAVARSGRTWGGAVVVSGEEIDSAVPRVLNDSVAIDRFCRDEGIR
jgi:hypothetical protein